jgi:7-carboxy-7-deazaguanine synthase
LISLSPKLSNSTPREEHRPGAARYTRRHDQLRDNPETVRRLTEGYDYQVKFVVDRPEDLAEIDEYLSRYDRLDRARVFLMPQARSAEELREKTSWIEREAEKRGVKASPRLHVEWWGNRRGV